ncbi:cobalt ECF transporter T component CbiQ [Granulicatella sp. zg-ZJ]|uniref:cobalt ECF transporter T component CbiQ n=1 Tax=Granulicatella sp. zg-ZJ TaxID=2678504 RepID=UPI0013D757BA|nr:cobalt ECF transporter T component CbiQ [Granulicatella sp. zg-ZJ]MBS4749705.1 cobalt ECF transporter T component CbiQ [Carnobacteriaceae bacterium zg-ZUI78]NEW61834.1 cobalt ECF transporter T component CbiQ [Granulicatella sp. zg-ZJ]
MLTLDKYAHENRLKHVSPEKKLCIYIGLLLLSFSGIAWVQLAVIGVIAPITVYIARVKWTVYAKWQLVIIPFIFISLLTFVLTYGKNMHTFVFSIPAFHGYIGMTEKSIRLALEILLRVYSSCVSTYFFVLTVPFSQLIQLMKKCKVPTFLLDIIVLMYRFIFLVLYEFITMRDTLDLKFSFKGFKNNYRAWGILCNTLFIKLLHDNDVLNDVLALKFEQE